ncbi:MAG: glycosyltransferase family 4 protein [Gammaproteobacteria bacterium]|nr:glycosyltransferase family 4 protein [Gammaproteobacteria bacterium]
MPRIVHLSSVHPTFDTRIFSKECRTLVAAGYQVVLVTTHPKDEVVDGVQIKAIAFPKNRLERIFVTVWRLYRRAVSLHGDLYHFHDPELLPVGVMLRFRGKKVIYDAHENVPKVLMSKSWLHPLVRWPVSVVMSIIERVSVAFFTGVVAATPPIARRFPSRKTVVVQNYPRVSEFQLVAEDKGLERSTAWICYVGGITAGRGALEMVRAIGLMDSGYNARLRLAGPIRQKGLENQMRCSLGWERTDLLGWLERPQIAALFSRSAAGLVVLHPERNHIESQPNKLFEYMSAGLPVIASDFPLWREIIDGVGCGILVDPLDPQAISEAMTWIFQNPRQAREMGVRGRRAVQDIYHWEKESEKLLQFYKRVFT